MRRESPRAVHRATGLNETIGRGVTILAYGLLLIASFGGALGGGGYLIYAQPIGADPSIPIGGAFLAVAMACISMQQLHLAGFPLLRLRPLANDATEIAVPRSGIPMSASGIACGGFAIWSWIFFGDFGLGIPALLFGCAALILAPLTVLAWRRFRAPFQLRSEGVEYGAGWQGLLRYDNIVAAELQHRSVPYLVLHLKRPRRPERTFAEIFAAISRIVSGIAPANGIAVSVFDLAVQPQSLVDAINRRIEGAVAR